MNLPRSSVENGSADLRYGHTSEPKRLIWVVPPTNSWSLAESAGDIFYFDNEFPALPGESEDIYGKG